MLVMKELSPGKLDHTLGTRNFQPGKPSSNVTMISEVDTLMWPGKTKYTDNLINMTFDMNPASAKDFAQFHNNRFELLIWAQFVKKKHHLPKYVYYSIVHLNLNHENLKQQIISTYPLSLVTWRKFRRLRISLAMMTMYKMFMVRNMSAKVTL